jgi:isopenicillin N synthase-like dioxygenase
MTQQQTIPVVDLRDFTHGDADKRARFVQAFGTALEELGFVAVEGHGVPDELLKKNYSTFKDFFALDLETKQQSENKAIGRQRGYTSFGVEHAKDSKKADLKEFYHVGQEVPAGQPLPQNIWSEAIPQMRDINMELFRAMEESASHMLAAFSLYLGKDERFLPDMIQDGNSVLRIIHYPVCDGFDEPGVMRAAAHEDINLITLLPEATESGLELLKRDGTWMPVPTLKGQMIVDTGDMMKWLTNDRIPATTHRVVNPQGTPTPRYSMPFFVHPRPGVVLDPNLFVKDGEALKNPPIESEEFLAQRLREIGLKK